MEVQPHMMGKIGSIWAKLSRKLSNIGSIIDQKTGKNLEKVIRFGKIDTIWVKSKSCIPKNIRAPTAIGTVFCNSMVNFYLYRF